MTHLGPTNLSGLHAAQIIIPPVPTSQKVFWISPLPHSLWLILLHFICFFLGLTTHTKSNIIWKVGREWPWDDKKAGKNNSCFFLTEGFHCSPHSPQIFQCHLFILLICFYFKQSIRTLEMFQVIFAFVERIIGLIFFAFFFSRPKVWKSYSISMISLPLIIHGAFVK